MIIVDTSIWVDHLHRGDDVMAGLLAEQAVLLHPYVLGELALGSLRDRKTVFTELENLPTASLVAIDDILEMIDRHQLGGSGIGLVDAHLLASTLVEPGDLLWTRDRRLAAVAARLGVDATSA